MPGDVMCLPRGPSVWRGVSVAADASDRLRSRAGWMWWAFDAVGSRGRAGLGSCLR